MKNKFHFQAVQTLALRFSILLTAFIIAFSLIIIFLLRFRIRLRQDSELVNASNVLYESIRHDGGKNDDSDFDFANAENAELPYYITYTIYSDENVFSTNDPFLPLLPVTKKHSVRYYDENYFSDGDLNILYYAKEFKNPSDSNSDSDLQSGFIIQTALNIDTDESIRLLYDLPKIMLAAFPPLLILSYFASLLIAKRVMKNVHKMTETAMKISGTNLEGRLPVSNRNDEFDELAKSFNDLLSRLQSDLKREKQFVSDVSHELGTPLSVILGHANLIKRWGKNNPEQLEKSLDFLIAEAKSMESIIENLLMISRMESGRIKINKTKIDVAEIFSRIIENTKAWANEVSFEVHITEPYVFSDESLFYESLTIVVSNSVKFAGKNAKIILSSEREGDFSKIKIVDNGPGFSSEVLPHVFERFYRGDEAHTRSAGGSGLGLSIVKSIMKTLNGNVNVANGKNGGAEVILYFPTDI